MIESHYAIAVAATLLTSVSHVILKTAATKHGGETLRLWLNWRTFIAYALMFAITLMNLHAYRVVPLRANVVISPLTLFGVAILSVTILGEQLTRRQAIGCAVILAGIAVYNV